MPDRAVPQPSNYNSLNPNPTPHLTATMQQLWPEPALSSSWQQLYTDFDRSHRQPWVMLNMVQSLNGATTTADGLSEGLSSAADQQVFALLRSLADFILVGAGTARLEDYGPAKLNPQQQAERLARGQAAAPTIAVVSGGLSLDPASRLFSEAVPADAGQPNKPIVLTASSADPEHAKRKAALAEVAEVLEVESPKTGQGVDLAAALDLLRAKRTAGAATAPQPTTTAPSQCVVLCEGGPKLNAELVRHNLIAEYCLSLSPTLVAGQPLGLLDGLTADSPANPNSLLGLSLLSVLTDGDMLFLRYGQPS